MCGRRPRCRQEILDYSSTLILAQSFAPCRGPQSDGSLACHELRSICRYLWNLRLELHSRPLATSGKCDIERMWSWPSNTIVLVIYSQLGTIPWHHGIQAKLPSSILHIIFQMLDSNDTKNLRLLRKHVFDQSLLCAGPGPKLSNFKVSSHFVPPECEDMINEQQTRLVRNLTRCLRDILSATALPLYRPIILSHEPLTYTTRP